MANDLSKDEKNAEWRGYTIKALEDIGSELERLYKDRDVDREDIQNLRICAAKEVLYRKLIIAFASILFSAILAGIITAIVMLV